MQVRVDLREVKRFAADLKRLDKQGAKFAMRDTLNGVAFAAREEWQREIQQRLTLRNRFTVNSVRVVKAGRASLGMKSVVGSVAPYMGKQETGFTQQGTGKHGKAIPTAAAAGQGKGARRTKTLRRRNYLSSLSVTPLRVARTGNAGRRQRIAAAIAIAGRRGVPVVVFLDFGRRKGLFRVTGGKRPRVRMLYDLSQRMISVDPHPTMEPAVKRVMVQKAPAIAEKAIARQIAYWKTRRKGG